MYAASKKTCNSNEFRCKNGYCIEKDHRCNNWTDCSDGSDEENCARNIPF